MNTKRPADMTTEELVAAVGWAERLLDTLRAELNTRPYPTSEFCGHRWSNFSCKLKPGHQGRHSQGFVFWDR